MIVHRCKWSVVYGVFTKDSSQFVWQGPNRVHFRLSFHISSSCVGSPNLVSKAKLDLENRVKGSTGELTKLKKVEEVCKGVLLFFFKHENLFKQPVKLVYVPNELV